MNHFVSSRLNRLHRLIPILILLLPGCGILDNNDDGDRLPAASGVIVANGGNFSDQNGSLTIHDPESRSTTQSGSMGGFVQGVLRNENRLLALINTFGPGRIDILDGEPLEIVDQWSGMDSPRDAVIVDGRTWVTTSAWGQPGNLLSLDADGSVNTQVQVGDVPEGVAAWGGSMVVANNGSLGSGRTLSVLPEGAAETSSVDVGCDGPRDLYAATDLIVICSGKTVYSDDFSQIIEQTPGQIVFLDTEFNSVSRIVLDEQIGSTNGTETGFLSASTDELFLTLASTEEVLIVDTATRQVSTRLDVSGYSGLIGLSGIAYDAGRDQLYIGRFPVSGAGPFPDFAAAGTIQVMDRSGNLLHTFQAGASISSIILESSR